MTGKSTNKTFKPGPKPELGWVPLDQLEVDETYQRNLKHRKAKTRINKISENFQWSKFAALVVSKTDGGKFMILDGQHRFFALKRLAKIKDVPCYIVNLPEVEGQAESFVTINKQRTNVQPIDVFRAKVASKDPAALELKKILTDSGVKFAEHNNTAQLGGKEIVAVHALEISLSRHGREILIDALIALSEAYGDEPNQFRGMLILGVCLVYARFRKNKKFDPDAFIEALGEKAAPEWLEEARAYRAFVGTARIESIAAVLLRKYNSGRRGSRLEAVG